jgi:hypothetical protein
VTLTPDLVTHRKLAIVKQVYLDATRQRAKATPVARLLAVVGYDLAIETALKATIRALDPRAQIKGEFRDLTKQANSALLGASFGDLPQSAAIQVVRNIRNAAQHEGRLPTTDEENECHVIARGFLDELLGRVWAQSLAAVQTSQLVLDPDSKARLEAGDAALLAGDYATAIAKAGEALEWALLRVKNALVGRGDTWVRAILTEDTFGHPKASRDLTQSIERTQSTVLYLALGLDYGEYIRFKSVAGTVRFMSGGNSSIFGAKDNPDHSDAESALAYSSESIIQIEARVGSLQKPYGREHWY